MRHLRRGWRRMKLTNEYWGIVIAQSLQDDKVFDHLRVLRTRALGRWEFILVSMSPDLLDNMLTLLQNSMVNINDDCWYAHFFRDSELIVVYQDKMFSVTVDPSTWGDPVGYGSVHGIPIAQLDFHPRTVMDARSFFGV